MNLLKIAICLIIIISVATVVIMYLTVSEDGYVDGTEPAVNTPNQNSDRNQAVTPFISVVSKSGGQIKTRDFLNEKEVVLIDSELQSYKIGREETNDGTLYEIFYIKNGGITISLQDESLAFARARAEEYLINFLRVNQIQLCSMDINVTTPVYVSESFSGRNLGLTVCPGSIALE